MRSRKIAFSLLLTTLLLIGIGCLPGITGAFFDLFTLNRPEVSPIQQVQLHMGSQPEVNPGRMFQYLALERDMQTIPISPDEATMRPEQVYQSVEAHMDMYSFFSWFDVSKQTAEPYLAIDPTDPDYYGIIWVVDYARKEDTYHNLFVHVEDSTGKILKIDYYTEEFLFPPNEQRYLFEEWTSSYFQELGLSSDSEYIQSLESWTEDLHNDDSMTMIYHFQEIEFGLVSVSFTVNPNGFFISIAGSREGIQWGK